MDGWGGVVKGTSIIISSLGSVSKLFEDPPGMFDLGDESNSELLVELKLELNSSEQPVWSMLAITGSIEKQSQINHSESHSNKTIATRFID